jgi:UTP--glucose-1-phosphate uridylyltransferase
MHEYGMTPRLRDDLRAKGVDIDRTLRVVDLLNAETNIRTAAAGIESARLPSAGDARIRDLQNGRTFRMAWKESKDRFDALGFADIWTSSGTRDGDFWVADISTLRDLGIRLYPRVAYGVLNGGSATTYGDRKKNQSLDPASFSLFERDFERLAQELHDKPKGITCAYVEADGSPGPSFLLLKFRSLLIHALEYRRLTGDRERPVLPFFQMTSMATDTPLKQAYEEYREHPLLADLIGPAGIDPTKAEGAVQGFLAALTHSAEGKERRIFDRAYGKSDTGLAMPGGHGENFRVLSKVYASLRSRGYRWIYIGNVDNSGYTIDPVAIAAAALGEAQGAMEFSWRTALDVKGGVLVERPGGILSVADIGQAIRPEDLAEQEASGGTALFNCATGLFDLEYLVPRLEAIADTLPIRVSDQDKEAGRYSQAEQTTWEVLGLLDRPQIFAVPKERRFIAAKMLMETLLAGPLGARIDSEPTVPPTIRETAARLRKGLYYLLENEYGFSGPDASGRRRALSAQELALRFGNSGRRPND